MPTAALWSLVVGFILLATGVAIKNAGLASTLKEKEDDLSRLKTELEKIKTDYENVIPQIERVESLEKELSMYKKSGNFISDILKKANEINTADDD